MGKIVGFLILLSNCSA